ncbi:FAD-dependent oxidoreductase [Merismopedia glauca]|uniref:Mercuric reductase n=1 Tax=Merismopedia glauca CCAP 1448/3 TaxID=1296344 RepID=A0A2T1C5F2_9CYAN|nr:NAD(P)/FAD-dependent oxidoreductase [Merismopedia glauca]PSB03491.1 mercuric reductase [Merismopedia glauca CCAP 1448/3]
MAVAYDLVIISSTWLGRQIALKAAGLKARVALVEINPPDRHWLGMAAIYQEIIQVSGAITQAIAPEVSSRWLKTAVANLDELDSLAVLATLGIDVIQEKGEFCRLPHLAFSVKNRYLRGRSYLVMTANQTIYPEIAGIEQTYVYNSENLGEKIFFLAPQQRWVVIGGNATGVEFAQILNQLGARVTLVVKGDRILPHEDVEIATLLQAQLEAQGIRVITQAPVELVKQIDETKWVQAGNQAIETDEIFLAVKQYPQVANLNLEGVGVELDRRGIKVNRKLQTTNPKIYACSSHQQSIAAKEGQIALQNALFFPRSTINYHQIPTVVFSQPPLARIGLTEAQAKSIYGQKVFVLREYFKHLSIAQISGNLTGMCQIILRPNGEIIGAQILGAGAIELIEAIALSMQHKVKIQELSNFTSIYPSYTELFSRLGQIWQEKNLSRKKWLAEGLDLFFDWRRGWSK